MEGHDNLEADEQSRSRFQLEQGIRLAREGDRSGARAVFQQIIHYEPDNEDAWLWLAWLAEDKQQGLQYLREAEVLLPGSERITEAMNWLSSGISSRGDDTLSATDSNDEAYGIGPRAARGKPERSESQVGDLVDGVLLSARDAGKGMAEVVSRLKERAATAQVPRETLARFRGLIVPVISLLAIAALAVFVMMGVARARSEVPVVRAQSLPTPVPDATATPTVKQRTDPFWVQVDVAYTRQDWDAAITALQRIREIDPHNENARKSLAVAYYQRGIELIRANELEEAQVALDWAIRLDAGNQDLQQIRRQLKLYLDAVEAYWAQDWMRVVEKLEKVYALDPGFRDTRAMLAQAYYEHGVERQAEEVWEEARDSFQRALDLNPAMNDAQSRLTAVMDELIPPKRIEVDLSDYLVTVYEEHVPKYVFKCCIGRPTAPTVPGRYEIQSKMPMAYASQWDLDMPWWLGIYYAGGSENGFHALPILSSGQILWRGALGTGCSFGCIVLDTEDAKTLYDWAEIGVVVLVNP